MKRFISELFQLKKIALALVLSAFIMTANAGWFSFIPVVGPIIDDGIEFTSNFIHQGLQVSFSIVNEATDQVGIDLIAITNFAENNYNRLLAKPISEMAFEVCRELDSS